MHELTPPKFCSFILCNFLQNQLERKTVIVSFLTKYFLFATYGFT